MIDTKKLYDDFVLMSLGLKIIENFITDDEEKELIQSIEAIEQISYRSGRSKVMRFGSSKCYDNYMKQDTLPDFILKVAQKIVDAKLLDEIPDHASINEYKKNGFIPKHIDSNESGDKITIVSLLSDADMFFEKGDEKILVPLPRKSLIQMKNEIRWLWEHSIPYVENLRYSIVFRNSKQ